MRKLTLWAVVLMLFGVACGSNEEVTVATPPAGSPKAVGDNDHGTKTFTTQTFTLDLELDNFYFEPTYIKAPGASTVMVKLENHGDVEHNFSIEALNVDKDVEPKKGTEFELKLGTETRYNFFCKYHENMGMRGAFMLH